jgi:hypothetical protein
MYFNCYYGRSLPDRLDSSDASDRRRIKKSRDYNFFVSAHKRTERERERERVKAISVTNTFAISMRELRSWSSR